MTALQAPRSPHDLTPAEPTKHGQSSDGALATIQSRANRLRHANQIRRARYIRLHQVLSKRKGRA